MRRRSWHSKRRIVPTSQLGYRVAERAAGRGVATATVRDICSLAASRHAVSTLRAATSHGSVASQRVLLNAGFTEVGPADPSDIGGKQGSWYQRDTCECGAMENPSPTALADAGAVVTGAGHGIGRALASRLVAEGARVVVNDLDDAACRAVAEELGAIAAPGDCSSDAGVRALVETSTEALGRIDIFMANAGIDRTQPDSLQASDEDWARMIDTNVMAHIRASRLLVPRWLEDGLGGRFVVTASAAGLLTMIGAAPYSVTKHAAVGFAEWLSVTYGHRGIAVQAICPQGVQTRMLEQAGPLKELLTRDAALTPEQVADAWVDSLAEDRFLVLPHPEVGSYYAARAADPDAWLAGMRRLQAKVDEHSGVV